MFTKTHEEVINLFESETNFDQGLPSVLHFISMGNKDYTQAVIDIAQTVLSDNRFNKEGKTMALNLLKECMATNQHFFAISLTKPKVFGTLEELALKSRSLGSVSLYPSSAQLDNLPIEFYKLLKDLIRLWGTKYDKGKDATFKYALLYQKLKDKGVQFPNEYEHLTQEEVRRYSVKGDPGITPREGDFQPPIAFTPRQRGHSVTPSNVSIQPTINIEDYRSRPIKTEKSILDHHNRSKSSDFRMDTPSFLSDNFGNNMFRDTSKSRFTVDVSRPPLKLNTTTNIELDDHPALFADSLLSTVFDISSIELTHGDRRFLKKPVEDDEHVMKSRHEALLDSNYSSKSSNNRMNYHTRNPRESMEAITERISEKSMTYRTPKKDTGVTLDQLSKENEELKEKISRLKELIIIEKEKAKPDASTPTKDKEIQIKYDTLRREVADLKEQNSRLLDVIDVQNAKIENYKRETGKEPKETLPNESWKKEKEDLLKSNQELKDSLEKEKIRLQSLVSTIDSYRKIIEDLQTELAKKDKDPTISSDKSVLVPICEKNKELTFKIQSLETALSKNQEKTKQLVGQNKELREKNAEFDVILKQELQRNKKFKDDLLKKEMEIKHLTDRIISGDNPKPSNNPQIEDLKDKLAQEIDKNQSLRNKLADKTKEHIDEIKSNSEVHRDEMMKLTDEIMRLNNNMEVIQEENLKIIERNKELEQVVIKLKNVEEERNKIESQFKSKSFQIQTQNHDLKQKIEDLESRIQELEKEKEELQSTYDQKEQDFHRLLKQQIEDLRSQYKDKEEKLKEMLEAERLKIFESNKSEYSNVLDALKPKERNYKGKENRNELSDITSKINDTNTEDCSSVPSSDKIEITPKNASATTFREYPLPKRVVIKKERVNSVSRTRDSRSECDNSSSMEQSSRHRSVPKSRNKSVGNIAIMNTDLGFALRKNLEHDSSGIHSYNFDNEMRGITDYRMCATTYTGFYPRTQERSRNNSASSHKKSAMMNMDIPRTSRFSVLPENENVDPKHLRRIREACLKESSVIIENEYLRVEVNHELESHFEASSFPDIKFYIKYYNKFKYPLENFEIIQLQIPGFIIIGEEKPGSLLKTGQSQHHLLKLRFKTLDPKMASFTINFRTNNDDIVYKARLPTVIYKLLKFRNITPTEFIGLRKDFLSEYPHNLVDTGKILLSDSFLDLLNKTLFDQMCQIPTEGSKGSRFSVYGAALTLEPLKNDFYLRAILENGSNLCIFQITYAGPSKGFAEAILDVIRYAGDDKSAEL